MTTVPCLQEGTVDGMDGVYDGGSKGDDWTALPQMSSRAAQLRSSRLGVDCPRPVIIESSWYWTTTQPLYVSCVVNLCEPFVSLLAATIDP